MDTLPEGKQVYSGGQSVQTRVSDWKPSNTIDKTDVVGTMEAVEEAQLQVKDKSAWRKSTLNVPNSSEETKDDGSFRPATSHYHGDLEQRKGLISSLGERPASDKLTLYIRKPADTFSDRRNNKVEIDQDNIETPPAVRRVITPTPTEKREPVAPSPCRRFLGRSKELQNSESNENNTPLGDGQFDRFSAARRTRRYKRNTETNESPELLVTETEPVKNVTAQIEVSSPVPGIVTEDRELRLKAWQERLKTQSDAEVKLSTRRTRNQTGINQDDLKKALHFNTSQPIDIVRTERRDIPSRKTKEHDNDEGFEETQSLMSESPSQGASSGGNYETDLGDSTHQEKPFIKPKLVDVKTNNTSTQSVSKFTTNRNFDRNNSIRQTTQVASTKKSTIPRRTGSLRKTDSQSSITSSKRPVQRSGSRNSILSSRSSLNSSTSTNTVKRIPQTNKAIQPSTKSINLKPTGKLPLRRSSSSSSNVANKRPPRPGSSFMKPTASSSTKVNTCTNNLSSRLHQPTYRSKN